MIVLKDIRIHVVLNDRGELLALAGTNTALEYEVRRIGYRSFEGLIKDGCTAHETTVTLDLAGDSEVAFAPLVAELTAALDIDDFEAVHSIQRRIYELGLDRAAAGHADAIECAIAARGIIREHAIARRAKTLGEVSR